MGLPCFQERISGLKYDTFGADSEATKLGVKHSISWGAGKMPSLGFSCFSTMKQRNATRS
jgi:hypothetical protein